jgi:hypothetical protein
MVQIVELKPMNAAMPNKSSHKEARIGAISSEKQNLRIHNWQSHHGKGRACVKGIL